jgi:hypothetical protein
LNTYPEGILESIKDLEGKAKELECVETVVAESVNDSVDVVVKEFGSAKKIPPWIDEADSVVLDGLVLSNVIVDVKSSSTVVVISFVVIK